MVKTTDVKYVPMLRFPEFEDEWEETRLDEVFSILNGYAFSSNDAQKSGCRWVKIADVGINEMKTDTLSYLPMSFQDKYKNFLLNKDDFVIALTRPILSGKLKIAKVGKLFDGALLNQRVGKLISNNVREYVYHFLQCVPVINKIENRIAGSDPPNLSPNEIGSIKTYITDSTEQEKIASFLSAVDKKVQQLTARKELLEQYKKGVMQKIFSQEIRFTDDNRKDYPDWEEKKLGDVLTFISTNSLSRNDLNYESGKIKNIHYGDIHTTFKMGFVAAKENVPYVNKAIDLRKVTQEQFCQVGDVVIADASEDYNDIGKAIEICDLSGEKIVAGLHTFLGRDKTDQTSNGFKGYLLQVNSVRKQIQRFAQGISVLGISKTNLAKVKFQLPCKKEQIKIVTILKNIDKIIASVQTQLSQTQTFKKGLLQQMFV